jgi:hypothetical protein
MEEEKEEYLLVVHSFVFEGPSVEPNSLEF